MKRFAKKIYRAVWGRFMDEYSRALEENILSDCRTLLDVGCGECSPLRAVAAKMEYSVGVDAHAPALEASRRAGIHADHVVLDVMALTGRFKAGSFDCVAATDLIEHLEKADGYRLLDAMESIARRKVIVFTPNGFLSQAAYDGNEYQIHRSGWSVEEMEARGYHVIGISGWKPLRGARALIRWWPRLFWEQISFLTQPLVAKRPRRAFQLFCVKTIHANQNNAHEITEPQSSMP